LAIRARNAARAAVGQQTVAEVVAHPDNRRWLFAGTSKTEATGVDAWIYTPRNRDPRHQLSGDGLGGVSGLECVRSQRQERAFLVFKGRDRHHDDAVIPDISIAASNDNGEEGGSSGS